MFESALTDMLKGYTDKRVHQAVLTAEPSAAQVGSEAGAEI